MPQTVVAINAHPDDEAILMGGTLARLSAAGHRVVLVTATDGDAGVVSSSYADGGLGTRRLRELRASAMALGVAEVIDLGYGDSGMGPANMPATTVRPRLTTVAIEGVATQVADILTDQGTDIVIGYDPAGGYGHRDHVHIHHIVRRAVPILREGRTVRFFEATAPRERILSALRLIHRVRRFKDFDPGEWASAFTPSTQITHRVDVRSQIHAKRAALNAHESQHSSDNGTPMMAWALLAPTPLFRLILGREYFVEPGREAPLGDGFDAFEDLLRSPA